MAGDFFEDAAEVEGIVEADGGRDFADGQAGVAEDGFGVGDA